MNRILVVSPHPDDESLGCGGTLRKHVVEGDEVHVIFITSGEQGGHGRSSEETLEIREREAKEAVAILGIAHLDFWRVPDTAFRITPRLVKKLQDKIRAWRPHAVYVTHDREMHPAHRAAAQLVKRALSNGEAPASKPDVYMFEVWTPLQAMDRIVDISEFIEIKRKAIQAHQSQCEAMDFDEALLALNRYRGEMHSWPGGDYAEIFAAMKL
ncbi:MAG TPA: PIG-L deacetylase family protein [bacterium]|nr:PIG-L deacetylase family protein [bacterium]